MTSVTVVVPLTVRRRGGRKQIIGPDGAPARAGSDTVQETRGDPVLVKALAHAFRWRWMLEEGRYASVRELSKAEGIDRGFLGKILQLTLLAPDLVGAILGGWHGDRLTVAALAAVTPNDWDDQRTVYGLARRHAR